MAERVELPRLPAGEPEAQLQELYNYLYRMAETLNQNLAEIGTADLTDAERDVLNSLAPSGTAEGPAMSAISEAETLKSLIIKTASWIKSTLDSYRINLLGEYVATGKFGKYVRNTRMDVEVTPTGTTQNFKFSEIIEDLKRYEISAKNYIKTGLLRTENGLPVYGIAVGKDIVTFSQDGTETYHDENKVGEFTADALTFYVGGKIAAKYAGNRIGFYNNGTEYMYISGGKIYVNNNLDGYSTTSQTNQAISNAVADKVTSSQMNTAISDYVNNNAYKLVSGIGISSAGVDITGSKYINLLSGAYINIGSWTFNSSGVKYRIGTWEWFGIGTENLWSTGMYCYRIIPGGMSGIRFLYEFPRSNDPTQKLTAEAWLDDVNPTEYDEVHLVGGTPTSRFRCGIFEGTKFVPSSRNSGSVGASGYYFSAAYINSIYYYSLYSQSSRDIKHKIQSMPEMGERLDQLEPVTFIYDNDPDEKTRHGLIYEDTVDVMPEICTGDEEQKAVNYTELIPILLKEIQSLRRRVKQLEDERS